MTEASTDNLDIVACILRGNGYNPNLDPAPVHFRLGRNCSKPASPRALRDTPPGGSITCTTAQQLRNEQAWGTLTIQDTEPGLSPQELPRLFERFYRGQAARNYKIPGTGLGLAMSKEIMRKLGGSITVESEPGHGAAFTVWLQVV